MSLECFHIWKTFKEYTMHRHVLSVLDVTMWNFWLRNWIACILNISPIFLLFFLEFLITLSFLNDCYNKENCSLCVALLRYILIILSRSVSMLALNLDAFLHVGSLALEWFSSIPLVLDLFFSGKGVVEILAANSLLVHISSIFCVIYLLDFKLPS